MKELKKLIDVKTIVTFTMVGVSSYLAISGGISADNYWNAVLIIIGFYFGTQKMKKEGDPFDSH